MPLKEGMHKTMNTTLKSKTMNTTPPPQKKRRAGIHKEKTKTGMTPNISSSRCLISPSKKSFSEAENRKLSENTTENIAPPPTQKRVNNIRPKHAGYAGLDFR